MTNSQPHSRPSAKQLNYLRGLVIRTGQTFAYPTTSAEASAEIRRLLAQQPSSGAERSRDTRAVRDAMAKAGGAARVREEELGGYGSTAHRRR